MHDYYREEMIYLVDEITINLCGGAMIGLCKEALKDLRREALKDLCREVDYTSVPGGNVKKFIPLIS